MSDIIALLWIIGKILIIAVPITLVVAFLTLAREKSLVIFKAELGLIEWVFADFCNRLLTRLNY